MMSTKHHKKKEPLVGTRHGHFKVARPEDVENTALSWIPEMLVALMVTSFADIARVALLPLM
jgi:hypothetical protein